MNPTSVENRTLLVVDDEPTVLNLCQSILARGGYSVLRASNAEEALRVIRTCKTPILLALLDVIMPGMNGIELANRIQNEHPSIRVVLMSGYGVQEISRLTGREPVNFRTIWKPFRSESLLRMIENVLDEPDASARAAVGGPGSQR
ncbi:MAG: response regulator [Bryobacteraceae bacterium]